MRDFGGLGFCSLLCGLFVTLAGVSSGFGGLMCFVFCCSLRLLFLLFVCGLRTLVMLLLVDWCNTYFGCFGRFWCFGIFWCLGNCGGLFCVGGFGGFLDFILGVLGRFWCVGLG